MLGIKPVVLVLGMPGSGKTTCGNELAHELRLPFRSMGDVLRTGRASGVLSADTIDPASAYLSLELLRDPMEFSKGLVLDFSPVTPDGNGRLRSRLLEQHFCIDYVIFVKTRIRDAEMRYVSRGRRPGDPIADMRSFFRRRLVEEFHPFTLPMVRTAYDLRRLVVLDNRGDESRRKQEIANAACAIAILAPR